MFTSIPVIRILGIILLVFAFIHSFEAEATTDPQLLTIESAILEVAGVAPDEIEMVYLEEQPSEPVLAWVTYEGEIYMTPKVWKFGGAVRYAYVFGHEVGHWMAHFKVERDPVFAEDEADFIAVLFCAPIADLVDSKLKEAYYEYIEIYKDEYQYLIPALEQAGVPETTIAPLRS